MLFYVPLAIPVASGQGGGCGCTNCPLFMPDNFVGDFLINVIGATNNDLSDPNQGICEIRLTFDHQYIGDLSITLTSPSGETIVLVGPIGLFGESDLSTWDVSFIPCADTPMPDFGNGTWENSFLSLQNYEFTGSYHPLNGCLENFDSGPVNGTWTLTVTDGQAVDVGTFIDYEIIFCDDDGINCNSNPCGIFATAEAPSFACQGDTVVIDASGSAGNTFVWGTDDGEFVGNPTGPIVQITESGTYYVTVSDNGGCPEVATIIFNTVPEVPTAEITVSDVLDCNNEEITLQGATNTTEDVFVNWIAGTTIDPNNFNPLGMDFDLVIDEPGTYTMIVINTESACSQTATITVEDESEIPVIETEVLDTITCTTNNVNISASSDITGSTFSWSGPNNFNDPTSSTTAIEPGVYSLTVTAPNGCIDSTTLIVASDTIPPMVAITASNEIDCSTTDADLTINTADEITSVNWTGPNSYNNDIELNPSVNVGGTYTLIATTANGCTTEATIEVIQNADIPDISTVNDGVIDCNNQEFALSGGSNTAGVSYEWVGPNGFILSDSDAGMVSDTGLYILTVFSDNGCSVSSQVFVDADTIQPMLSINTPNILGCTNTMTTLSVSTSEIITDYNWSGPNGQSYNIENPEIDGPGIYELEVTGENGCLNTFSIEVESDESVPDVDISILVDDIITCNNQEVSVINNNNDPDYIYAWSSLNGYTSDNEAPMLSQAGVYSVTVTGANGCTSEDTVTAFEDNVEPDINFTTNEITCTDNVVTIGVSSTETITEYSWTGENGYTSNQQNPADIVDSGVYTAVITAANGCTNSVTFNVTENSASPDGQIIFVDGFTFNCNLTSLTLLGSSDTENTTLQWEDPLGDIIDASDIVADMVGTYTLVVTAANGCVQELPTDLDEDLSGPLITNNPDVDLFCTGGAILSVASNENIESYAWTGPNGYNSSDSNPNVNVDGLYEVVVTGENGCTSASSVQVIDQQVPPIIFVDPTQTLVCGQNQITISGGSDENNTSFSWTTLGGSIISATDGSSIMVNAQGTYILSVTDNDTGCEETAEVIVNQDNNTPIADISAIQNILDCNVSTITLNAEGSDYGNGFEFVWGNEGGNDLSNEPSLQPSITAAGTYSITVTNVDNQCTSIASISIEEDVSTPNIELSEIVELNCNVTYIQVENLANNSASNLVYNWQVTGGGNIISATDLDQIELDMPGAYSLMVTNPANGCSSDFMFEVTEDIMSPLISAGNNLTLDCGVNSLSLEGSIESTETNLSILWTTEDGTIISGEDTLEPEVGSAALYTMNVINNDNGCSTISMVFVAPNQDLPVISFEPAMDFNCSTASMILDASNSTNGVNITYQWTNDEGHDIFNDDTPNPEIFEPGEYTLTIINNSNNCQSTNTISVGADTLSPSLILDTADELSCVVEEVGLGVSSDLTGLDLQWNAITGNIVSGETSSTPLVNQAGEYVLTVTNIDNQCTASANVMVMLDEDTPVAEIAAPEQLTCNMVDLTLDASNSTQGNNISISWEVSDGNIVTGEDGLNPTVNMPGTYTLTISDDTNGCSVSQSVVITENTIVPEVIIDMPDILNCNNQTIDIQAINQGVSDYTYSWSSVDGNIINGEDSLNPNIDQDGNYMLVATDISNGCSNTFDIVVEGNFAQPNLPATSSVELTCDQEIVNLAGMGASMGPEFIYSWTDENGDEIQTDLAIALNSEGIYTLEITNIESGCSDITSLSVIDIRELPEVVITPVETITCAEQTVQLIANDLNNQNLEYSWQNEQGDALNIDLGANIIEVDQEGIYELNVINPVNGCASNYSVIVQANQQIPNFSISTPNNGIVDCENPTLFLVTDLIGLELTQVGINWTTINGNFVADQNTLNPEINAAGIYQLEITDLSNGCMYTDEVVIEQDADLPLAALNNPDDLNCNIQAVTLSTPLNGNNLEVIWTLDGELIPLANTNEITVNEPGEYMVTISNLINGCSSFDQIIISQDIAAPDVDAGDTFELQCDTPEFELNASVNGNGNFELIWDAGNGNIVQGESTLNPLINQAGTYTLLALNTENGCTSTDVTSVTVNENIPIVLLTDIQDPQCEGDLGSISNLEVIGGEGPFMFSIDGGNTFSDQAMFNQLSSGNYEVEAVDANGCLITNMATIEEPLDIAVYLPPEIEIILGDSAQLSPNLTNINPDNIQSIIWSPSSGLSCDDCLYPTITSTLDIQYTLEIILDSGCSVLDDIQLRVDRNLNVYVPNAFTPFNLDGFNDEFYLLAKEKVVTNISSFAIYDRWGNEVFFRENIQPNDSSVGWDGIFRDEELPIGVYIYYIEVVFRNGSAELLKGDVLLSK